MKRLIFAVVSMFAALALADRPQVILDSDCLSDWDDVGALAILHTLADRGECDILATVACTVDGVSPQVLELVNSYYGRPKLPVGCCAKGCSVWQQGHGQGHVKFLKLVSRYPEYVRTKSPLQYEDAVQLYRRTLAKAKDGSVTVCSLGFLTNLRDLLVSGPDVFSPLNGRELVAKKVKLWVCMGCNYPNGKEYNSKMDPEASRTALAEWPTPIVFTDFQYGRHLYTGRRIAESSAHHRSPVKDVFKESMIPLEKVTPTSWDQAAGHPSWDETAVLIAVRGTDLFNLERGTYRMVGAEGDDEWIADAKSPNCRVTEKAPLAEVGRIIDGLMCEGPKPAFPVVRKVPAPPAPADLAWVDKAIARFAENYAVLLGRTEREGTFVAPFPRSCKKDGTITYCKDWDWCSGFFQGSLWYLYEDTGDMKWRMAAEKYTDLQAHIRFSNLHHDLGFMFLPSAGNGLFLTGEAKYADWLHDAARTMQTRFRPKLGAMQSWGYWGEAWKKKYNAPVIIDNMLNLELWMWAANNPPTGEKTAERDWLEGEVFREMAETHADTSIGLLVREDGSTHHIADCDRKTGKLIRNLTGQGAGHWSRGQAWAVYGYAMTYGHLKKASYFETAVKCADWALNAPNLPEDGIPYWDYMAPNIPNEERDTSAAAVLACGLLKLSAQCETVDPARAARYREAALRIAKSLSSDAYFAKPDEIGGFVLKHAVGSKPDKAEIDVPLNYGDYYYLELLLDIKRSDKGQNTERMQ